MSTIITPSTPKVPTHIDEFIKNLKAPNERILQALYQHPNVIEKVIEDLKTPLHDELPKDIKIYHNDKLQKWFEYEAHYTRYYVKAVPNFERVPSDEQIYVHYYYDGILARFGVFRELLINRASKHQEQLIIDVCKNDPT